MLLSSLFSVIYLIFISIHSVIVYLFFFVYFHLTLFLFACFSVYIVFNFLFSLLFSYHVLSRPFPTNPSPLSSMHSSLIQLGEEKCTTSSPACQQRTSIVPWAEGKTKIILFAEIHSRNISCGKGSYPLETRKKRNHVKARTTVTNANNKMLFVTLHGFLIIFHILRKSFHLKLQPWRVRLEAKLWWLFSPPSA